MALNLTTSSGGWAFWPNTRAISGLNDSDLILLAARPGMGVAYLDGFAGVLADVVEDITDLRDKVADGHGSDPEQ